MANINQTNLIDNHAKINAYAKSSELGERIASAKNNGEAVIGDAALFYTKNKKEGYQAKTAMDNFDEFLKNKKEQDMEDGIDEATREKEEKENAKEIARNLSDEELQKLRMMGVDVDSAKLSDIMSMVNTIRGNEHREQSAELMAQISIDTNDVSGLNLVGGSVKTFGSNIEIESVSVSEVVAVEVSEEEQNEHFSVSNDELTYLMKNHLDITKENLFKAHFSGSKAKKEQVGADVLEGLSSQINKVLDQVGFTNEYESLAKDGMREIGFEATEFLLNNELPVTADNVRQFMNFQQFVGQDISDLSAKNIDEKQNASDKAKLVYDAVQDIRPEAVYDMMEEGMTVTISSASVYSSYVLISGKQISVNQSHTASISAMRQMEEIRLSMTMEATYRMVNADFNIDTRDLSQVVNSLKHLEQEMLMNKLLDAGIAPTEENQNLYQEMTDKISGLGDLPISVLGAPLMGGSGTFSVNYLYEASTRVEIYTEQMEENESYSNASSGNVSQTVVSQARYESIRQSYEAVGTAPRADMGDSIGKAFQNVDDILRDMNLPVEEAEQRAVRILGYNQLTITEENIYAVMDYDRQVTELMDTFYPEAVLSMIKDGINPLDVPIDELNERIREKNYNGGVTDAENFATYLRDVEKHGDITKEERESYIGIYRVINKLAKSKDREAGFLFANHANLTVRNLITAMRSKRAAGIDVTMGEDFGMLEGLENKYGIVDKKMDTQIEAAFTKQKLEEIGSRVDSFDDEVEQFIQEINDSTVMNEDDSVVEANLVNASAVNVMLHEEGGIYALVYDVLKHMKFDANNKEEMIDEETENMSDSLSGEDIPYDFSPKSILEALANNEDMSLKYEDLQNRLMDIIYDYGASFGLGSNNTLFGNVKTIQAGFQIMGNMAKQNRYQVPVETKNGLKVMNVSVKHDENNRGNISVSVKHEEYGMISASVNVSKTSMQGYVVAEYSVGNEAMLSMEETLKNQMGEFGLEVKDLHFGTMQMNESTTMGASEVEMTNSYAKGQSVQEVATPEELYQAAVNLVTVIGELM